MVPNVLTSSLVPSARTFPAIVQQLFPRLVFATERVLPDELKADAADAVNDALEELAPEVAAGAFATVPGFAAYAKNRATWKACQKRRKHLHRDRLLGGRASGDTGGQDGTPESGNEVEAAPDDRESRPDALVERHQIRALIRSEVARLSPADQRLFRLHYIDELPLEDIARIVGTTGGTVRKAVMRIRTRLAKALANAV